MERVPIIVLPSEKLPISLGMAALGFPRVGFDIVREGNSDHIIYTLIKQTEMYIRICSMDHISKISCMFETLTEVTGCPAGCPPLNFLNLLHCSYGEDPKQLRPDQSVICRLPHTRHLSFNVTLSKFGVFVQAELAILCGSPMTGCLRYQPRDTLHR